MSKLVSRDPETVGGAVASTEKATRKRWRCTCWRLNAGPEPCECGTGSPFGPQPTDPRVVRRGMVDNLTAAKQLAASRLDIIRRYAKENERLAAENLRLATAIEYVVQGRSRRIGRRAG